MHSNSQSIQTFSQTGRVTADLVWGLRDVYVGIRTLFGQVGAFVVALVSVAFLRIMLWFIIGILKKMFKKTLDITPQNYKDVKTAQATLSLKTAPLTHLKEVSPQSLPFLLRGVFGQILTIVGILEDFNATLQNQLAELDNVDTGDTDFKVVPESALWTMRTAHYDYRF